MKKRLQIRWGAVAVIWLVALVLTYVNSARIDEMHTVREKTERSSKEHAYQRRQSQKLAWLKTVDRSQYLPVQSNRLGLITVRNHLYALAVDYGLSNVDINTQMGQALDGKAPMSLKVRGAMGNAMRFLAVLNDYAYLPANNIRITVYADAGQVEIEAKLTFQFTLISPEEEKARSLNTASARTGAGWSS